MGGKRITVSGTGCALADYLYADVSFHSPAFGRYLSREPGDGGLSPGRLVFTEELERFAGVPYPEILKEITHNSRPASFNIGGPGLVALIHAAQMLQGTGVGVRFYGLTGRDETADRIFRMLQKTPLITLDYKPGSQKPTPFTDVFSDPEFDSGHGERTFVNNIGAAWDLSPENLPESFFDSEIVCFGGTALTPGIHDELAGLLMKAKARGCVTVVNTVYDFRNEKSNPGEKWPLGKNKDGLNCIDLLIMDMEEALKISGTVSQARATEYFMRSGAASFVITDGARPVTAFSNGSFFREMPVTSLPVVKITASQPGTKGDTTGCGDNFAGGMIASVAGRLMQQKKEKPDMPEALSWAIASGGFACTYIGGTYLENAPGEKYALVQQYRETSLSQARSLQPGQA